MKRITHRLLLSTCLVLASASLAQASPVIVQVNPTHSPTTGGVPLTIDGTQFGASQGIGSATVGGDPCQVLQWSDSRILCVVPEGTGTSKAIAVDTDSGELTSFPGFAYDAPSITGITPSSGPEAGGTVITLTGNNFGPASADARRGVAIGATGDGCVLVFGGNDHTKIVCTMPPGSGSGVSVTAIVDGQVSNSTSFDYIPPLSVSSVTPSSGSTAGNFPITIAGTSFKTSGNSVTVGGAACPPTSESTTEIVCTLPEGLGLDQEVIVSADGQTAGNVYFDYSPPSISSITPSHAPTEGNVAITIQGSNFGPASADAMRSVKVGLKDCPLLASVNTHTELQCMMPAGQGTSLGVQVTVAGQTSNVQTVSYDPPSIGSIEPARVSALGGDRITIHGLNFGSSPTVKVRGVVVVVDVVSQHEDQIEWLAGADTGGVAPVVVDVSGQEAQTTIEFVVPDCGDAFLDHHGEVCDDGNNLSGDGCSSDCRSEHNPDKDEVSCILAMNKAAAGIFKAQAKDDLLCATKGDGSACVGASVSDGVTKANEKAAAASDKKCPTTPAFGSALLSDLQDANVEEELAFMHDLFGADPDGALADSSASPNRASCQNDVLKAEQKYMAARLKAFGKCKKSGFKEGTIITDTQLAACLETADDDPALAKPAAAQFAALIDSCINVAEDTKLAFPGSCSLSPSMGVCIESLARCHTCLALKRTDSLPIDCDFYDNSNTADQSCGDD